jgi:hypothetical protein
MGEILIMKCAACGHSEMLEVSLPGTRYDTVHICPRCGWDPNGVDLPEEGAYNDIGSDIAPFEELPVRETIHRKNPRRWSGRRNND